MSAKYSFFSFSSNGRPMRLKLLFFIIPVVLSAILLLNTMMTLNRKNNILSPEELAQLSLSHVFLNYTKSRFNAMHEYMKKMRDEVVSLREKIAEYGEWERKEKQRNAIHDFFENSSSSSSNSQNLWNPHVVYDDVTIDCNVQYKLVVLISSNAPHIDRRNTIRAMWGNRTMWKTKEAWTIVFVLGATDDKSLLSEIRAEARQHRDILLEDVGEDFYQLSRKVMIGLQWVVTRFNSKFDFVLKGDDDVFVHIDRLMKKLSSSRFKDKHYIGQVMADQPVERSGRYALTKLEHPNKNFDPYCSGGGYILSRDVITKIVPYFNWTHPLKIDDAYIGQLVFRRAGVKAYGPRGFYMWNTWCEYDRRLLVTHPVKQEKCLNFLQRRCLVENGLLDNYQNITSQVYGLPPDYVTKNQSNLTVS